MTLPDFLRAAAQRYGAAALDGAIVFVNLDRETDRLIIWGMERDPVYKGRPSRFSHTFLLAGPYDGAHTPILDMTIRDEHDRVDWDVTFREEMEALATGIVGRAGRVYRGAVSDYDHPKTTAVGLKLLRHLSAAQRAKIVEKAEGIREEGYHYDLVGLGREAAEYMGIELPVKKDYKGLFCSAFVQRAYRRALGRVAGDFSSESDVSTSPNDLWYGALGDQVTPKALGVAPTKTIAVAGLAARAPTMVRAPGLPMPGEEFPPSVRLDEETAPFPAAPPMTAPPPLPEPQRYRSLGEALVTQSRSVGGGDEAMAEVLRRLASVVQEHGEHPLGLGTRRPRPDDMFLSLVWSDSVAKPTPADELTPLAVVGSRAAADTRGGGGHVGFEKYELLDPRWIASLANRLARPRLPYPKAKPTLHEAELPADGRPLRICLTGDWGTGSDTSKALAARMVSLEPDILIHLGDVYYSGTEKESARFVNDWPRRVAASFALNSNHEMYSGGEGYFGVTLAAKKFAAQKGCPFFCISAGPVRILGLDSAYHALHLLYDVGTLGPEDDDAAPQRVWLAEQAAEARKDGQRLVILSHHHGLEEDLGATDLLHEVLGTVGGAGEVHWYWGHIHAGIVHEPVTVGDVTLHGRCTGHGGVPWAPFTSEERERYVWAETRRATHDASEPRRALNGFVVLDVTSTGFTETFYDELGGVAWPTK